jgi:hypothetical protein
MENDFWYNLYMRVCPTCNTQSIASNGICMNCKQKFKIKINKKKLTLGQKFVITLLIVCTISLMTLNIWMWTL